MLCGLAGNHASKGYVRQKNTIYNGSLLISFDTRENNTSETSL
jgi:hypothetical protein